MFALIKGDETAVEIWRAASLKILTFPWSNGADHVCIDALFVKRANLYNAESEPSLPIGQCAPALPQIAHERLSQ